MGGINRFVAMKVSRCGARPHGRGVSGSGVFTNVHTSLSRSSWLSVSGSVGEKLGEYILLHLADGEYVLTKLSVLFPSRTREYSGDDGEYVGDPFA